MCRMSTSSHGATELLMSSGRGHGSGHEYGASLYQEMTFGFLAWRVWKEPNEMSCITSSSLFAIRFTLTSSLGEAVHTNFLGAGSGWKPVLAPHQLSSRTKTKSVGLAETNLYGPLKTGDVLLSQFLNVMGSACPSQMCLGMTESALPTLTAKFSRTKRGLGALRVN